MTKLNKYQRVISYCVIALVVSLFSYVILTFSINIPYWDDYDVFLNFIAQIKEGPTLSTFISQHNEHRIFLTRILVYIQYVFTGEINFVNLIIVGNLFLLGILYLFYCHVKDIVLLSILTLVTLIPGQELNLWATSTTQNIGVVFLAFLAFHFLYKKNWIYYGMAIITALLATFTSGSGFLAFLAPIPVLAFLWLNENVSHTKNIILIKTVIWIIFLGIGLFFYFYNYQSPPHHPSILPAITSNIFNTINYFLVLLGGFFKGSLTGIYTIPLLIIGIGLLGVLAYLFLVNKAIFITYPAISSLIIFILLSAGVLAVARSGFGIGQSLSERYFIIPSLFFASIITFSFLQKKDFFYKNQLFIILILFAFYAYSLIFNMINIWERNKLLDISMKAFWNESFEQRSYPVKERAYSLLNASIGDGYYIPPKRKKRMLKKTSFVKEKKLAIREGELKSDCLLSANNLDFLSVDGSSYIKNSSGDQKIYLSIYQNGNIFNTLEPQSINENKSIIKLIENGAFSSYTISVERKDIPVYGDIILGIKVEAESGLENYHFGESIRLPEYIEFAESKLVDLPKENAPVRNAWSLKKDDPFKFYIEGWAFLEGSTNALEEKKYILLYSDKRSYIVSVHNFLRKDVTTYFSDGNNYDMSGIDVVIYKEQLKTDPGKYRVGLYLKNTNGKVGYVLSESTVLL